ncbi:uncharacterized protein LOC123562522 [Mercenaria mercenaria]|uniref:uncharacterized protein LOC123562522 n=1 Tax=Mercenaria mercenaria TaxID=6596 RepID=UPI00234E7DAC|nr:uncharacterized protein LOC123562522 [Mercenaria mercenaria]
MQTLVLSLVLVAFPCAINSASTGLLRCYQCANVNNASECNTLTTCQQDELCGIEMSISTSGSPYTYTMGCYRKHPCIEVTRFRMENEQLFQQGHVVGKRNSLAACSVCCGSSLCNTGNCYALTNKLRELWKAGLLDITTLAIKTTALQ